jgi:hypothetical protein
MFGERTTLCAGTIFIVGLQGDDLSIPSNSKSVWFNILGVNTASYRLVLTEECASSLLVPLKENEEFVYKL